MSARPLIDVLHRGGACEWAPMQLGIPFGTETREVAACTHPLLPGLALHFAPLSDGGESRDMLTFSHIASGRRVVTVDMVWLCDDILCGRLLRTLIGAGNWSCTVAEIASDRQLEERLARGADAARELVGDIVRVAPTYTLNEAIRGGRS